MATQDRPDQLIVQLEGKIIRVVSLNTPVLTIGRTPENGLTLAHQIISRHHADVRMEERGVVLTDLGSANGTFLNNERLLANQPYLLNDGATFRIGPYSLTYRAIKKPAVAADEQEQEQAEEPHETPIAAASQQAQETPRTLQEVPAGEPEQSEQDAVVEFAAVSPPTDVMPAALPDVSPSSSVIMRRERATPVQRGPQEKSSLYLGFLPDIFQEDDFLKRFLHIFEDIWEPLEHRQDHIEMYFDPRTCPASFLPWLASWLDLPFNPHWPEARHRRLLSAAMELYSWRGTAYGLTRMIEVCTGLTPLIRELPSQPFVFHIRIIPPPGAPAGTVDKDFIEELIQTHKPAHAGYVLEVNL